MRSLERPGVANANQRIHKKDNTRMDSTQSSASRTRMDSIRGFPSAETDASKMGEFLTALGDIQSIDIDKLKARLFQTEKPVSQNMRDDLIIESNRILESQKKETEIVRKQLEEEQKFSKEYVNVFGKTKINDLNKMLEDMYSAIEKLEKETQRLKEKNKHLEEEKQKALEEKSNALTRLSKQMTDSNPNIADLSDQNRSSKLVERYSEMYDNNWTNAFEALTETCRQKDEVAIQILIKVLIECHNFAKTRAEVQIDELVRAVTGGSSVQVGNEMKLHLKKARKLLDISRAELLLLECESYVKRRVASAQLYLLVDKKIKEYLKECFQICWLMAIQDLPVVLGHEAKHLEDFNMMLYKPYTRSGTKVDFVVLPPLLLHEGGPLLAKGVAQPILEKRKVDLRSVKQIPRIAWGDGDKTKHRERFTQTIMKQDDVDHRSQASRIMTEEIPRGRTDERKHQLATEDTVPTSSSVVTLANPPNLYVSKAGNTQSAINLSRCTDTGYRMQPVKTFYTQTSATWNQDNDTDPVYKKSSNHITTEMSQNSQKMRSSDGKEKHDESAPSSITKKYFLTRDIDHGYESLDATEIDKYLEFVRILRYNGVEMARILFKNSFERYSAIFLAKQQRK